MRKAKRVSQKRTQVARQGQHQAKRIDRKHQNAARSGLNVSTSWSTGQSSARPSAGRRELR
jgi:hypothetical protein